MCMWRLVSFCTAMGKTRKSFYAVKVGRSIGVFRTWEECESQVKRYPGAVYKGFATHGEADSFAHSAPSSHARERYSGNFTAGRSSGYYGGGGGTKPNYYKTYGSRSGYYGDSDSGSTSGYSATSSGCYGNSVGSRRPVVYSDGCCINNGRPNAKAGVGVYWGDGSVHNLSERLEGNPTNQRAEIVAACRALEGAVSQGMKSVEVRTDSSYTIKAMTEWLGRWKQNGWKTAAGDVKNVKDFKRLDDLCQKIDVKWTHVPGHKGIKGNEAADQLSKIGSQQ